MKPCLAQALMDCGHKTAACVRREACAQDIIALEDLEGDGWRASKGDVIYQFGNEVRSLCHPKFMRALYNRRGDNFDVPEDVQTIV